MRSLLAHLDKAQSAQNGHDFLSLEGWNCRHLRNSHSSRPNKLRRERWLTIFEKHLNNLPKIVTQLLDGLPLRVRTWPSWDVTDEHPSRRILLDYGREVTHILNGSTSTHAG
jgi:hypothetical protein